jgi:hypothetical protein
MNRNILIKCLQILIEDLEKVDENDERIAFTWTTGGAEYDALNVKVSHCRLHLNGELLERARSR